MPKLPAAIRHILHKKGKPGSKSGKNKDSAKAEGETTAMADMATSSVNERRTPSTDSEPFTMQGLSLQPKTRSGSQSDVIQQHGSPNESEASRLTSEAAARPPRDRRGGPAGLTSAQDSLQLPEHHLARKQPPEASVCPPRSGEYGRRSESEGLSGGAAGWRRKEAEAAEKVESITSDYRTMTPTSSLASSDSAAAPPAEGGGGGDGGGRGRGGDLVKPCPAHALLANADAGFTDSLDSLSSSEFGSHSGRPTVIERRQNTAATPPPPPPASIGSDVIPAACQRASPLSPQHHHAHSAPVAVCSASSSPRSASGSGQNRPAPGSRSAPIASRERVAVAQAQASSPGAAAAGGSSGGEIVRPFAPLVPEVRDGELFPRSALSTPIGALRKSRPRLCLMLNIDQQMVDTEFSPDYKGLADMLGFEAIQIQNFWERNPSDTLFMEWARGQDSTLLSPVLGTLVDCLERLGRRDVLEDCRGLILEDVRAYIAEQQLLMHYTVERLEKFDCYVNIAEQDMLTIGREIIDTLEGVYKLRLCLTLRDITLGGFEFEKMAEMLETRCGGKCLIVLSKSYEKSDACTFLAQFAVSLDPGSRKNKLIPLLVDEDTFIPRVLRCLAMLNYNRDRRLGFLWPRLYNAITQ